MPATTGAPPAEATYADLAGDDKADGLAHRAILDQDREAPIQRVRSGASWPTLD